MLKNAFAAVAALTFVTAATMSCANAGGMRMHSGPALHSINMHSGMSMPNHLLRHHPRLGVIIAAAGVGCGDIYDRWIFTGDYFWKYKYEACRYGW